MTEPIHSFQKSFNEYIQITISEFNKKKYVDLRTYFQNDEDELMPTKKGITFSVQSFYEFKDGIEKLEKKLLDEGLIGE